MARKSSRRSRLPRRWRRTKVFLFANVLAAVLLGGWYLLQPPARQEEVARLVENAFDQRKAVTAFDVAWDVWQLYFSRDFVGAVAPGDRTHVYGGPPRAGTGSWGAIRLLVNRGYVVGYSDRLGNPLWVAYRVPDAEPREAPPRPERFAVDLRTAARIEPDVYGRSGYDRGHLAPNYAIATRYGAQAQEETFLMSNIVPQTHELNAGLWKQLEQRIATGYPARFGEIWVVAGPVFGERPARLRRRVTVPEAFFMVVVDESDGRVRAAAFLLPQTVPEQAELDDFLVSIDEIERRTGLDLLAELPDDAEAALEARVVERVW